MRRRKRPREMTEFLGAIRRMVRAAGNRGGQDDVEVLAQLAGLHQEVEAAMVQTVAGLRAAGYTWKDIGGAYGVTSQAATIRWLHRLPVTSTNGHPGGATPPEREGPPALANELNAVV